MDADQDELVRTDDALAWHYTNGPGLISILRSDTLWATGADRQVLQERPRRLTEDGIGPAASRFHILSASQLWDSLAM